MLFNSLWHYLELKEETGTPDPPFSEEVGATESSELPALSGTAALARCPLTQTCPGPLRSRPPSWISPVSGRFWTGLLPPWARAVLAGSNLSVHWPRGGS